MFRIVLHYVDGHSRRMEGKYASLHQAIGIAEIRVNAAHSSNTTHPVAYVTIVLNGRTVWDSRNLNS
jgi:hypothetical protein